MFIELTMAHTEDKVLLNVHHIINASAEKDSDVGCRIASTNYSYGISVKESYEEVSKILMNLYVKLPLRPVPY